MKKNNEFDIISSSIDEILKKKLPNYYGPWKIKKTPTGQSNPTYILRGKNKTLILRKKPFGKLLKSAHLIEREFRILNHLSKTDLPVPKVYYLSENIKEIGSSYFIMDYLDGITFSDPSLPKQSKQQRDKIYKSMNKGLSDLHSIIPKKIGLDNYGKTGNFFQRQLSRWSEQYEISKTSYILEMERLKVWLFENLPNSSNQTRIVHGDWRIDNLIFDKKTFDLIGIIDWELSTLGDPILDLGTQIMQWYMPVGEDLRGLEGVDRKKNGIPNNHDYITLYCKNRNLNDIINVNFAIIFSFYRMASILQGVKKRALQGNASNPEKAMKLGSHVKEYASNALKLIKY